jgi:hypothetical protein
MQNKVVVQPQQQTIVKVKPGGGSGADQYARDIANAAFEKANSAVRTGFTTIAVTSDPVQNAVISTTNNDTVTLIASTGILLESDPANNSIYIVATGGSAFDETARDLANAAVQTGYTQINANGTLLTTTTNADILILEGVQSNGILITANTETNTIDFELQPTGVTPNTYGDTTNFLQLTVDIYGRILAVANVMPVLDTSVLATGVLEVPRGGTGHNAYTDMQVLIGNTITGNLDTLALTAGNGIELTKNVETGNLFVTSNLTLPIQSKSVSYGYPLIHEVITLFYTNTAIQIDSALSVAVGINPNVTVDLIYTDDRSNLNGTLIKTGLVIDNVSFGIKTTTFDDPFIPANNFILLHASDVQNTVTEIAMTLFFHNFS